MMPHNLLAFVFMIISMVAASSAVAEVRDDFPSCYNVLGHVPQVDGRPQRELFVFIDQTLSPDVEIKRSVHRQVHSFIQPGDKLTLVRFSAFIADNYTDVVLTGRLDQPLDDSIRYGTAKKLLKRFDTCMKNQEIHVKKTVDQKLSGTFGREDMDIPKTELVGNLSTLSQLITRSDANRKVILLFSDMLENSDISSFYQKGALRKIDPEQELDKYRQEGLLADWGGAEVYVMGAGLLPSKYTGSYRSENHMRPIRRFWEQYFKSSNSKLSGWGQPVLLGNIH